MDKLTIINKALLKCGLPLAATIDDCDWNANFIFDTARDEILRGFAWNFATKYSTMTGSGAPGHGFKKSYDLPDDCVRAIDVHTNTDLRSPDCRYHVVGRSLYTQATPCYLRYVSNTVDMDIWPPDFIDALACRIAQEIAPLSTQTMALTPQLAQLYQLALATAQATDAREVQERVPHDVNIMLARTGGDGVGKRA